MEVTVNVPDKVADYFKKAYSYDGEATPEFFKSCISNYINEVIHGVEANEARELAAETAREKAAEYKEEIKVT